MIRLKILKVTPKWMITLVLITPLSEPEMTAKMISTAVSVRIVPPTAIATASIFEIPYFETIGYATNVCVANILAVSKLPI